MPGWAKIIPAVVRVGDGMVNEACRKALTETLREIQRPEQEVFDEDDPNNPNDKPDKSAANRQKPTLKDMQELDRLPAADTEGVDPLRAAHARVNELNAMMRLEALDLGLGQIPPARRMTPCPNQETLAQWQDEFAILNGDKSAGIGKMMKGKHRFC